MSPHAYALGGIEATNRNDAPSPQTTARVAGLLYLVIIGAGIFAEFFVRASLKVPGDAAATSANIIASEGLFRAGIASDLIMIMADVALALLFYVLLRPVSNTLALLAAFFRLLQAAVLGVNLLNLFFALQLFGAAGDSAALNAEQAQTLGMLFLDAHSIGYSLGLVFFGVYLFLIGYLVFRSGYLPRLLGGLLMLAAAGYLVDSFAQVLLTNYAAYANILALVVFVPALVAELSLALWLLVRGVSVQQRDK